MSRVALTNAYIYKGHSTFALCPEKIENIIAPLSKVKSVLALRELR